MRGINILFVWPSLTGYMGDCWRELASREGVRLKIAVDLDNKYYGGAFDPNDVMRDLDWNAALPDKWAPDVVFTVGWRNHLCRKAAVSYCTGARKVCCFDMPWEWRVRKIAARFVLREYLKHFDAAFVNGISARKYARWLGFETNKIFTGLIGTNTQRFDSHVGGSGFLYVGRNASEKGLDVLTLAHKLYTENGGKWKLRIISGVSPAKVEKYYAEADCFVLPSRWEPWGVVLVEAAASGLPIICTDKCGARFEVVRENGVVVKSGDAAALTAALRMVESMSSAERTAMGAKGKALAKPFSCQAWADRVVGICSRVLK